MRYVATIRQERTCIFEFDASEIEDDDTPEHAASLIASGLLWEVDDESVAVKERA